MELNVNLKPVSGISDHTLVTRSRSTVKSATRDLEFLTELGVTPTFLGEWNLKIDALENVINYREQLTKLKKATQAVAKQATKVKVEVKRINTRLELIFPKGTDHYETIIKYKISNITPAQIRNIAGSVLFILNEPNPNFALLGITPEFIATFESEVNTLQALIEEQTGVKRGFTITTDERNKLKSEVFTYYQFVCKIGKAYWTKQNNGYFKDYNIYSPKSPPTTEVTSSVSTPPEVETTAYS